MRILFIEPYYEPDGGPAAPLFTLLSQNLVQRGHDVTVLTAVPHYPTGHIPKEFRGIKLRKTIEKGVLVIRVPLPSVDRSNLYKRLFQFAVYQLGAALYGLRLDCDVFVSITPALEVWLPIAFFSVVRGKPAIYSIHDVYPDIGIKLGIFRYKPLIHIVTALEKFCLRRATIIRILSSSFEIGLIKLNVPVEKIRLIYDWVDTSLIKPLPRKNKFARQHGLVDTFVILYAGNISFSQGLETVLQAALNFSKYKNVRFVFVGEGPAKRSLVEQAGHLRLQNVIFLPFQSRELLPEVLATADISLVVLRKGMGFDSLPSKTFSILASGRPLVASVDPGSDTWSLVERSDAGLCVQPDNPSLLVKALLKLKDDVGLRRQLSRNARQYALDHHSPNSAAKEFEKILIEAIEVTKGKKSIST